MRRFRTEKAPKKNGWLRDFSLTMPNRIQCQFIAWSSRLFWDDHRNFPKKRTEQNRKRHNKS